MFNSLKDALNFFASLESKQEIADFVAEHGNQLEDWEFSAAGLAMGIKGRKLQK